jgi:hypothetical protein
MRTRSAYFVVVPSREPLKPNADAFVEWLGSRLKAKPLEVCRLGTHPTTYPPGDGVRAGVMSMSETFGVRRRSDSRR